MDDTCVKLRFAIHRRHIRPYWRRVESLIGARIKCNVDDLASDALQTYQGRDVVPIDTSLSAHNKLAIKQNAPQLASFALRFVIVGDKAVTVEATLHLSIAMSRASVPLELRIQRIENIETINIDSQFDLKDRETPERREWRL